jgi:hypothetical protein
MANIFKRPMFRRGGSVADGVGITSGLNEPRARYANPDEDGVTQDDVTTTSTDDTLTAKEQANLPPELIRAYYEMVYNKMAPSEKETVADFLTSFGSSAGDPTELQTFGSALGKTSKSFQAINQAKIAQANKYAAQAAITGLKGLSKESNLAIQKKAKEAAAQGMFGDPKDPESYKKAYAAFARKELGMDTSPFLKSKSPQDELKEEIRRIKDKSTTTMSESEAKTQAMYNLKIQKDPEFDKLVREERVKEGLPKSSLVYNPNEESYIFKPDAPEPLKKKHNANDIVFDRSTRKFYTYDGKGKYTLNPRISLE